MKNYMKVLKYDFISSIVTNLCMPHFLPTSKACPKSVAAQSGDER